MSKQIEIRTSELIEYGALMQRMALDPDIKTVSSMGDLYYDIRDKTDRCMGALLKNDVAYFSASLHVEQMVFELATFQGMSTIEDFLSTIKKMDNETLLDVYLFGLVEVHLKDGMDAVKKAVEADDGLAMVHFDWDNLLEFVEQFADLKDRMLMYLEHFYQKVFLPNQRMIMSCARKDCLSLQHWYERDPEGFVGLMIRVNQDRFTEAESTYKAVIYTNVTYPNNVSFLMRANRPERLHIIFGSYVVKMFKASASEKMIKYLGDSTKMSIIKLLAGRSMYASEVASELNLNRATISHHIHQLVKVRAVKIAYIEGNKAYYEANLKQISEGFSRFVDYLEQLGGDEV